eukprot:scaffold923_cov256-Pinguiococcus_pyrenoidosus.AAC.13
MSDEARIAAQRLVRLEGRVAALRLRRDVHGAVRVLQDGVHGVAAGLEALGVDLRAGHQVAEAGRPGLLLRRRVGLLVEDPGAVRVQVEHHDVQGAIGAHLGRPLALVGHVHEPVVPRDGPQDVRAARQAIVVLAVLLQVGQLVVEAGVREELLAGEDVVLPAVADPLQHAAALHVRLVQQLRQAAQQRGRAAGLEHHLVRVHEQGALAQHVRVQAFVSHAAQDAAARAAEQPLQRLARQLPTAPLHAHAGLEAHLQRLLGALEQPAVHPLVLPVASPSGAVVHRHARRGAVAPQRGLAGGHGELGSPARAKVLPSKPSGLAGHIRYQTLTWPNRFMC